MSYNVDIVLDITDKREKGWPAPVIDTNIFPSSVGKDLVFAHRRTMAEEAGNYDVYIYSEDDILIRDRNINAYTDINADLPEGLIPGFLRYEKKANDSNDYLIDCHPKFRMIRNGRMQINGRDFLQLWNLHQGSWVMTDTQLRRALNSEPFLRDPGPSTHRPRLWCRPQYYGVLESGATDVYTNCGFEKVLPQDRLSELLIRHLPDKYVQKDGIWADPGPLTLKELEAELDSIPKSKRGRLLHRTKRILSYVQG
jgi:hypothetical protein